MLYTIFMELIIRPGPKLDLFGLFVFQTNHLSSLPQGNLVEDM